MLNAAFTTRETVILPDTYGTVEALFTRTQRPSMIPDGITQIWGYAATVNSHRIAIENGNRAAAKRPSKLNNW